MKFELANGKMMLVLAGFFMLTGAVCAGKSASDERMIKVQTFMDEWAKAGVFPDGLVIRVNAHLGTAKPMDPKLRAEGEARGIDYNKKLDEFWEFSAHHIHRIDAQIPPHKAGEKWEYVYRRVESHPFESNNLCKVLLDGKAIEIYQGKGTGKELMFAGTHFNIGGRSIELLLNGESLFHLGEHCTGAGFCESDSIAFAALYEKMAGLARELFKGFKDSK